MMVMGWKADLAKKVVETVVINFAVLAVKELFSEGMKKYRAMQKEREATEENEKAEDDTDS